MKRLTCEVCGSTDLIKEDGVFVCQSCGCKYTIEEVRKMMVEGTVEVQGEVKITNSAQLSNLLKMAHSAYDSKNYAKAEEFCDQIIAMDDRNYEAWKLKGEAINYQITATNPRILEVYNCLITSYKVLDDKGKEEHRAEILSSLKTCFEGEVTFWLGQMSANRPTKAVVKKAQNSFIDSWNKMKEAFEILGMEESKEAYLNNFDNFFINKAEIETVSCWNSTVAYNYYREKFSNGKWVDDDYRPTDSILTTFIDEADNLIDMMRFCIKQINDTTSLEDQKAAYSNIAFFNKELNNAQSWNRMVSTTTNGYGATISRYEYWENSKGLTAQAKETRQKEITECENKVSYLVRRIKVRDDAAKAEKERLEKEAAEKRFIEYWEAHASEKTALETERDSVKAQIEELENEIKAIPGETEKNTIKEQIAALEAEKSTLSIFKGKEKMAIQEKIDTLTSESKAISEKMEASKAEIQGKIWPLRKRIDNINAELTKAR